MRRLYSLLWYLASPLVAMWLVILGFRDSGWRAGWRERFGLLRDIPKQGIWVHAASVGEVNASLALIRALRERWPDSPLTLSTFTPSGKAHAAHHLPDDVQCVLQPFDTPGATTRFITRLAPRLAIIIETELWPNLYAACADAGVPLVLASARVTDHGARVYGRWRSLFAATLAVPEVIGVQTDADADRFERIGAPPMRVTVTGNIKFDIELPEGIIERSRALSAELGCTGRPVWIAASTHPGEETHVLEAHALVRQQHTGALLLLVPRHPSRGDEVAAATRHAGFSLARRSEGGRCADVEVFLLDTLGELALFYGFADVAFVGGSLVPKGGHNLLEPAAFSLPVVCGPYVHTIADMHRLLVDAGALSEVRDGRSLGEAVGRLLDDQALRDNQGRAAFEVLERNRGTVARVLQLVEGLLHD